MTIYPKNALEQLDFYRFLHDVAEGAAGQPAKQRITDLRPMSDLAVIETHYSRSRFFIHELHEEHALSLGEYDVPTDLDHCFQIEGFVLSKTGFNQLRQVLENAQTIDRYQAECIERDPEIEWPFTASMETKAFYQALVAVMDENGEIKPSASDELYAIVKKIQRKQNEISTVFERFAKQYRKEGLLSEIGESYRNGRRVLALPAENKRKIAGIIHGESESGKTVFIEPQGVTEVNNALFQLELDRQKEEYKILQQLSDELRLSEYEIRTAIDLLIDVDESRTKASYAYRRQHMIPMFDPTASLHLKAAFHPHLKTHLAKDGKSIVENDIVLHGKNHLLLLSGPNAGGKSVLLKTVAFNQLLFQCGLPVCADADSKFRLYETIALDMGDNQSIEDDLSTYSSHLQHMKYMLEKADDNTMLLIDEFGTGTDPRVGGALAESILHQFVKRGTTGIITTHYSNLKSYAHRMRGIVNGSMNFDMEKLHPTFAVQIGKPGSSFAFEIAKRMGLPDGIIASARKKAGSQVYEMEKLLSQLNHEKEVVAEKQAEIARQEKELKTLTTTYTELKNALDIQRKKLKAEKKATLAKLEADNIQVMKKKMAEIGKLAKAEEKIQAELVAAKEAQEKHITAAKSLHHEAHELSGEVVKKEELTVGDYVKIRQTDAVGKILALDKKSARVAVGALSVDVPYTNLMRANSPIEVNRQRSVQYAKPTSSIPSRLNIRGMTHKEASAVLNQYFDDALLHQMHRVEILHGRGNGVLRKLVAKVAREFKSIKRVYHPEEEAGGEGMSIVEF